VPQAPGLHVVGFNEEVDAVAIEKLVGAFARFGRVACRSLRGGLDVAGVRSLSGKEGVSLSPADGGLLELTRGAWKEKTRQRAGFRGFQSILRNAMALNMVRHQESKMFITT
jgi:hypothetical protein